GILATVIPWDSSILENPRSTISSIMVSPSEWRLLFQQDEKASMAMAWDGIGLTESPRQAIHWPKNFVASGRLWPPVSNAPALPDRAIKPGILEPRMDANGRE